MLPCEWFGVSIIVTLTTRRMQEVRTMNSLYDILWTLHCIYIYVCSTEQAIFSIIILVVTLPSSPHSHKYIICTQTRTHTHAHLTQSHCTAVPRWVQTVLSVFQFPRHTTAVTVVPAESQATLAVCLRTCVKGCLTARVKWGSVMLPSLTM